MIDSFDPVTLDDSDCSRYALASTLDELHLDKAPTQESTLFEILTFNDRISENKKLYNMLKECDFDYQRMLDKYGGADKVVASLQALDTLEDMSPAHDSSCIIKAALKTHRL